MTYDAWAFWFVVSGLLMLAVAITIEQLSRSPIFRNPDPWLPEAPPVGICPRCLANRALMWAGRYLVTCSACGSIVRMSEIEFRCREKGCVNRVTGPEALRQRSYCGMHYAVHELSRRQRTGGAA